MITWPLFAEPEDQGGQDGSCAVAVHELVKPGGDCTELLEAGEASLASDHVAVAVYLCVDGGGPATAASPAASVGYLVTAPGIVAAMPRCRSR